MSEARYLIGDVFARLADIPDGSVDLVVTSPPFWWQRAYLPSTHPDKALEIGQEPTPAGYLDVLLRLTAELRRVLAPHGSIAIELGDTMAGSGGAGGDWGEDGWREGQPKWDGSARAISATRKNERIQGEGYAHPIKSRTGIDQPGCGPDGPLNKSHCGIPEAYRLALMYGHHPLTGEPSPAGRWIIRNVVTWCRRNPTPGDDGDKFRRATSDIVCATLNPKRWWDGEAVREPATGAHARTARGVDERPNDGKVAPDSNRHTLAIQHSSDGTRPLYDWWDLASDPYPGAHYAVFGREIPRRLILAMCPSKVCRTCGGPSRRIIDRVSTGQNSRRSLNGNEGDSRVKGAVSSSDVPDYSTRRTVDWTDCGHDDWRRGHVLDPFGGSGTTGAVATGLGRDCTLIDIDPRNLDLARDRIGMFLQEDSSSAVDG